MSTAELLKSVFDKARAQITVPEFNAMVAAIEAAQTPGCTPTGVIALTAKVADRDRLIRHLVQDLESIRRNDASPGYEYHGKRRARPFDGTTPESGRWMTPREIAEARSQDPRLLPYLRPLPEAEPEEAPTDANPG